MCNQSFNKMKLSFKQGTLRLGDLNCFLRIISFCPVLVALHCYHLVHEMLVFPYLFEGCLNNAHFWCLFKTCIVGKMLAWSTAPNLGTHLLATGIIPETWCVLLKYVFVCADESPPVEPHLRERQGSGEAHADAGPCWEDHCLRGSEPPLAQGNAGHSVTNLRQVGDVMYLTWQDKTTICCFCRCGYFPKKILSCYCRLTIKKTKGHAFYSGTVYCTMSRLPATWQACTLKNKKWKNLKMYFLLYKNGQCVLSWFDFWETFSLFSKQN